MWIWGGSGEDNDDVNEERRCEGGESTTTETAEAYHAGEKAAEEKGRRRNEGGESIATEGRDLLGLTVVPATETVEVTTNPILSRPRTKTAPSGSVG